MIQLFLSKIPTNQEIEAVLFANLRTALRIVIRNTWEGFTRMVEAHLLLEEK